MRRRVTLRTITLVGFVLFFAFGALAQGGVSKKKVSGSLTKLEFDVPADRPLRVTLAEIQPQTDWIIGVKATEQSGWGKLGIGSVQLKEGHFEALEGLPASAVKAGGGYIEVSQLQGLIGTLAIYLEVPRSTTMIVGVGNATVGSYPVSEGMYIHRGQISPGGPATVAEMFAQLPQRLLPPDLPGEPIQTAAGRYVVSLATLRHHALKLAMPSFPPGTPDTPVAEMVALRIMVDADGNVVDIRAANGAEPLLSPSIEAVRRWKFRPFKYKGQTVPVSSLVFFYSKGGESRSNITD